MTHDPGHERLRERLLAGEELAVGVESELRDCPECSVIVAEHERTLRRLDSWGASERAHVEETRQQADDHDRAIAERAFARIAPRPRPWGRLLAAAGIVIAVGAWLARPTTDAPHENAPVFLGESEGAADYPVGEVDDYDVFRWTATLGEGQSYALVVWNDEPFEVVLDERFLRQESFRPTPEQIERLGPAIRWEIQLLDASGGFMKTLGSASASR